MASRTPSGLPQLYRLRGEDPKNKRSFLLSEGVHHVGRDASNRLALPDESISRQHAVLVVSPDRVLVEDTGSTNGTFINGVGVERAALAPGDTVAFGSVELRLELLHPEDAQLAMEISRPLPAAADAGIDQPTSTRPSAQAPRAHAAEWIPLIRRFFVDLHAGGDAARALATVVLELGVGGACLVDLAETRDPTLVAAYGDVDPVGLEALLPRLSQAAAPGASPAPILVSLPEATGLSLPGIPVGLVVFGEFVGRQRSESLLATLLEIYQRLRPTEDSAVGSGEASAELDFPPGWVPGVSPAMTALCHQMRPLVTGGLPVLVIGETGVGKELIAKTLHLSSERRRKPFVAINCAAIPADLLEAELFGIGERVATGVAGRKGHFRQAEGGTLLLDEIADMSAPLQAKLLRVLQEKKLHPVGGTPVAIDVRVVAATNADIYAMMEGGTFRRDLFYRIAGFVLRVPPLRDRREDVPLLVENFLRRFSAESGKPVRGVTVRALRALVEYSWPGNVRELEHEARRLVYVCPSGQPIELAMLPESITAAGPEPSLPTSVTSPPAVTAPHPAGNEKEDAEAPSDEGLQLAELERRTIEEAMSRCGGNKAQAARLLGISRSALRRRLDRLGP
ncbi:MAG: FHA domain-containing protein [bacterium]|nr:FHA domain-containing protein [bacterium]